LNLPLAVDIRCHATWNSGIENPTDITGSSLKLTKLLAPRFFCGYSILKIDMKRSVRSVIEGRRGGNGVEILTGEMEMKPFLLIFETTPGCPLPDLAALVREEGDIGNLTAHEVFRNRRRGGYLRRLARWLDG
jgi:hypothetical protein